MNSIAFLDFYKNLEDLQPVKRGSELSRDANRKYSRERRNDRGYKNPRGSDGRPRGRKKGRGGDDGDYTWLKINIGRRDGVSPPDLMKLINQNTRGKSIDLGRIDIQPTNTRFQVEKGAVEFLSVALRRKVFNGRRLRID